MKPQPLLPEAVDVVIYHADCADGFAAAWALHQRYGDGTVYQPLHYDAPLDEEALRGKRVLMIDVYMSRERTLSLSAVCESFLLIDHHRTALEKLEGLECCYLDMSRSGAGLAWDLAFPGQPRPPLIELAETRDLWKWERNPDAKALCRPMDILPLDFGAWSEFNRQLSTPSSYQRLLDESAIMLRMREALVAKFAKAGVPIELDGRRGYAACVPHDFASDVGNALSKRSPDAFGFTWCATDDGQRIRGSWRTEPGQTPVVSLAAAFGGGGHPNAAGAVISFDQLQQILATGVQPAARPGKPKPGG